MSGELDNSVWELSGLTAHQKHLRVGGLCTSLLTTRASVGGSTLPDASSGEFRTRNVVFKDALTCCPEHTARPATLQDAHSVEFEGDETGEEVVATAGPRPPTPGMDMVESDSASDDE